MVLTEEVNVATPAGRENPLSSVGQIVTGQSKDDQLSLRSKSSTDAQKTDDEKCEVPKPHQNSLPNKMLTHESNCEKNILQPNDVNEILSPKKEEELIDPKAQRDDSEIPVQNETSSTNGRELVQDVITESNLKSEENLEKDAPLASTQKHALVICDIQSMALDSIPERERRALMDLLQIVVVAARLAGYKIIFSGLKFSKDYAGISNTHKLFGVYKRLFERTGSAQWFVEDDMNTFDAKEPSTLHMKTGDVSTIWRTSHLPDKDSFSKELEGYTHVAVVGMKTGYSIQTTVQALCDIGLRVSVIEECVFDDDADRHHAVMNHLLPVYSTVMPMSEWLEVAIGLETVHESMMKNHLTALDPAIRYYANCQGAGHTSMYIQHLTQNRSAELWYPYPKQPSCFEGCSIEQLYCPLGKQIIDICDLAEFSKIGMTIHGREHINEVEQLWQFAAEYMPPTYFVENRSWVGGSVPANYNSEDGPYIVKQSKVQGSKENRPIISGSLSDALSICEPNEKYTIQRHFQNPALTTSGEKVSIKAYFLLKEKCGKWNLYMYQDAYLCISQLPWTEGNLSEEVQENTMRSMRVSKRTDCKILKCWPLIYDSCQDIVASIAGKALSSERIESRFTITSQFELFSADFIVDSSFKPFLLGCDMGCSLFDPTIDQPLDTSSQVEYKKLYDLNGDAAEVNDHEMISDTVSLIFEDKAASKTKWDVVVSY